MTHETRILVVGASSGIGLETVKLLAPHAVVYGASRSAIRNIDRVHPIQMDVTSNDSVLSSLRQIENDVDGLDVVVNCAGYGLAGPIEATTSEEAAAQLDTNLLGIHRVVRSVLPTMRRQGSGKIINVGSIAGVLPIPYQAFYAASKHALEAYSEALYYELSVFGIKVSLIQPGDIKTDFTRHRKRSNATELEAEYHPYYENCLAHLEQFEANGQPPIKVAKTIKKVIGTANPRLRYRVTKPFESVVLNIRRFLPFALYDAIATREFRVR